MLAIVALKFSHSGHLNLTSFDAQDLSLHQSLGHLAMGYFQNAAEGLPGDVHARGGLFLVKPQKVSQTEGLQFIHSQNDLLQRRRRDPGGFKQEVIRRASHPTATFGTRHN